MKTLLNNRIVAEGGGYTRHCVSYKEDKNGNQRCGKFAANPVQGEWTPPITYISGSSGEMQLAKSELKALQKRRSQLLPVLDELADIEREIEERTAAADEAGQMEESGPAEGSGMRRLMTKKPMGGILVGGCGNMRGGMRKVNVWQEFLKAYAIKHPGAGLNVSTDAAPLYHKLKKNGELVDYINQAY